MQRRAQRDQRDQRAKRLNRVLVRAAAVPVMLVATACSSDSGSGDGDKSASAAASKSASPSPTVRAAAFAKLPESCDVLKKDTLEDLVPKADKSGKEGKSDDVTTRGSCSWSSLDNNGVKGSQFRWLNVSLLRFESDVTRGAGDDLAKKYYEKQVQDAQAADGAKDVKSEPASGIGDEATTVRYGLKKKEGTFKQQTVVARVENVVVTVDYNGAGLAGEKTPDVDTMVKSAQKAAKEAVASVADANEPDAGDGGSASGSPSKGAKSPSASASASKAAQARSSEAPAGKS